MSTAYLRITTMDAADNDKFTIFNNAVLQMDDAFNRLLAVDTSSGTSLTLSESELTNYVFFDCSGHSVPYTLFVPEEVTGGPSPATPTNRTLYVRNGGSANLTIDHVGSPGNTVTLLAGDVGLVFATGSDIYFVAQGTASGAGGNFLTLTDTPASYVGEGGRNVRVNSGETALEFVAEVPNPAAIGTPGQIMQVNVGGTALEFAAPPAGVTEFINLTDTPGAYAGSAGYNVRVNGTPDAVEFVQEILMPSALGAPNQVLAMDPGGSFVTFVTPTTGATNFLGLTDTPGTYTADRYVKVNSGGTALEFVVPSINDLAETPAALGTPGQILVVDGGGTALVYQDPAGGVAIEDEGVSVLSPALTVNFIGPSVDAVDNAGTVDVTIIPRVEPEVEGATTRSSVVSDQGKLIRATANLTFTIEPDVTANLPIGSVITLMQDGLATVQFAAGAGVTVLNPSTASTRAQNSLINATKLAADLWVVGGDVL